jgi:N-methylhydantoinase B
MHDENGPDPVTREIVQNYLASAADTMAVTVVRTARSAVVKDGMDFSTGIFNAEGQQVAQGLTLPFHMGAMQPALDAIRTYYADDIKPGDIFANNDPYEGGSHLPDIFLFKPIFYNDALVSWTCVIAHQTDIGGRVAGGNACDNTEIYQEGLRIPPIKLIEEGVMNAAVWRILAKNVRVPDIVQGDVLAQISALHQGERDLLRLVDEYGIEDLRNYMTDIIDYTERLTRAEIAGLPDGSWEFTDYIDDDGINPEPIAIKVKVTVEGDEMLVDFTGTSPQAKGSINPNLPFTKSAVYAVFKNLTNPNITANAGFFRPFKIVAPPGCYVNAQHPAPVAARGLGGFRIAHAVFGAMSKALPDRVPGAWGGGEVAISFGGYYPDGKAFVFVEFNNDGPRGGGPFADGTDGAAAPVTNQANTPIESIEANQPLRVKRYGFVPDSEGPGKYRGGMGIVREFELTAEEATLQVRSDRGKFLPWGAQGGSPGSPNSNVLNPDGQAEKLPAKFLRTLKRGDVFLQTGSGAGGYGDPLERDAAAVMADVIQEKLTMPHVKEAYGVVLVGDPLRVDEEATDRLRSEMRSKRGPLDLEAKAVLAARSR